MNIKHVFLALVAYILARFATADLCALGSELVAGNAFCQAVTGIQYSNVGTAGQYNRVVYMGSDGTCHSVPEPFSGPNSPLDHEVSFHVRGPAQLHEFAVYVPGSLASANSKRSANDRHVHTHKHAAGSQVHDHEFGHEKVARQEISATIDGKVVSWGNNYWGTSTVPASEVMVTATIDGQVVSWLNNYFGPSSVGAASASSIPQTQGPAASPVDNTAPIIAPIAPSSSQQLAKTSETPSVQSIGPIPMGGLPAPPVGPGFEAAGTFQRISHYHAASQTVENVTFLGNYGGQGSGVFDHHFGASLAYANSDGTGGSAKSQILADKVIPSGSEVVIMHGDVCVDESCGYVRPGSVAHHGFGGADKIFLFEFSMPMDGEGGFNGDMPAIWLLHADIPRTVQYGKPECNCWTSGCGEFDIVEALFDGSTFLKSTLHTNTPAGDSDYIVRPTEGTMKLAVVFSSTTSTINIQVLDNGTEFSPTLTTDQVIQMCDETNSGSISHFHVSG